MKRDSTLKKLVPVILLLTLVSFSINSSGCASHSKTTRVEQTTTDVDDDDVVLDSQTVRQETTTTTAETVDEGGEGILGGTFHLIGEILAFPFRVVAGVFDFIF